MFGPGNGHGNELPTIRPKMTRNKSLLVGVFPYGKARTRRSPGIEHLGVGARTGTQPFKEIEDQVIEVVGHSPPTNHYRNIHLRAGGMALGPRRNWAAVGK